MGTWETKEFGKRVWTHEGWKITVWDQGTPDIEGPNGEDIDVDLERGTLNVYHYVTDGGNYGARNRDGVSIPLAVLVEYMKIVGVSHE
jgi:hypothetical protein